MKLSWTSPEDWVWVTKGHACTYVVKPVTDFVLTIEPDEGKHVTRWEVSKIRPTGQTVHTLKFDTLEGAFARAQQWEATD